MMVKKKSPIDKFLALPDSEKERTVAKYDKEFGGWDEFRAPTADERAAYNRAVRRGRPRIGRGAQTVAISVERDRLKKIDAFAKSKGISRSELLVLAAERMISAGSSKPTRRRAG